jgi:hypothetical protein
MFLTKHDLKLSYGIDLEIAAFHVDRKVPLHNLYWEGRSIYLPGAPGYLFIPLFADLLRRAGVNKLDLLNEQQLQVNEKILHCAALLEHGKISWQQNVAQVMSSVVPHPSSISLYEEIKSYLSGSTRPVKTGRLGTRFPSLNRADTYLISITTLDVSLLDVDLVLSAWYALMTYFLIMDDLADIREDLVNQEENVLLDAGLNEKGANQVMSMIDASIETMNKINPVMANRIDHKKSLIDLDAIIRSIR